MTDIRFPVIDPMATGENIVRLRKERGLTVKDLQRFFGFEEPRAIYKWQRGESLPTVDNLFALGALLGVPMEQILVPAEPVTHMNKKEQQALACCSAYSGKRFGMRRSDELSPPIARPAHCASAA